MPQAQETLPRAFSTPRRMARRTSFSGPAVAIIGSGFSGTMAAIHLRHLLPRDHTVLLFDQTGRFARGPAYAATDIAHLLNVRSANMSALPDDPGHFERWLKQHAPLNGGEIRATEMGTFASRRLYGRYLRALLFEEMTRSGGRVQLCADRATMVMPQAGAWRICFASGREITASTVILALGNSPSQGSDNGVVFRNPWLASATASLRPGEPVLIVGTGLTMVDLALSMHARGFEGPIIALSRRGLLPKPHTASHPSLPFEPFSDNDRRSLRLLLRAVRRRVREAAAQGIDWRAVMDALRPATASLWQELPLAERERFLRHLRPYWDSHRHRMAPVAAEKLAQILEKRAIVVKQGRVRSIAVQAGPAGAVAVIAVQERGRSTTETMIVQRVLHATGVGPDAVQDDLITKLVSAGHARTDAHGMGLDVTNELQLRDKDGERTPGLWALGPLVRGVFWECTAVPDIRLQAQTIATEVALALQSKARVP